VTQSGRKYGSYLCPDNDAAAMSAVTGRSECSMRAVARPTLSPARSLRPARAELQSWIAGAKPGERLTYHCGFLTLDRAQGSRLAAGERARLDAVAKHALAAAEAGLIHLVQRRLAAGTSKYIAVKAHARTASSWSR
jgi:hypothetical protein